MTVENLVHPDPDSPLRLQNELVQILQELPFVQLIRLGGSIVEGRSDRWSDVDMWIGCENVAKTQWSAAASLRNEKPVRFFRRFTGSVQPSGRYWLDNESAFHKVDISFHSLDEMDALRDRAIGRGHKIVEVRPQASSSMPTCSDSAPPLAITEREEEIGLWIRRTLDSSKGILRGKAEVKKHKNHLEGLSNATRDLSCQTVLAGGKIGELANEVQTIGRFAADTVT